MAVSLLTTWFSITYPSSLFALFIYWLGLILSYYCGFLVITKRYRELVPFPVICAVIHWVTALLAFWKGWQWLSLACGIVYLMLIAVPGRRAVIAESPE